MAISDIEWTNYVQNLWWGCQEIGDPDAPGGIDPACNGCYARKTAENSYWWGKQTMFPVWGQDAGRRFFSEAHYLEPYAWNRAAKKAGVQRRVFWISMGDWAEGRPDQRWYLDKYMFPVIEQTPWLIHLMLTKRPQLANSLVPEHWRRDGWPVNAWPGTTAVTQKWWDIRLPHLMKLPASQHFVSVEPMSEEIRMGPHRPSWIICGGQSGPKAKPMHPNWARSLRNQCMDHSIPFFFKQWGEWGIDNSVDPNPSRKFVRPNGSMVDFRRQPDHDATGCVWMSRFRKNNTGRVLDGRLWSEFPEVRNAK